MARLARLVIPGQLHHVAQRGHDEQPVFRDPEDYETFIAYLAAGLARFRVAVHAYVLMPTHFHLLATPANEEGLPGLMQFLGRCYVPYYNRKYRRAGTLWQGRYRITVIEPERYFLACCRYIETKPVRGDLVSQPERYSWSSCAHHSGAARDPLVADHALYWALGNTPFEREAAYRRLLEQPLSGPDLETIRSGVRRGWVLGSDSFQRKLSQSTTRRLSPAKRGRPAKQSPITD